MRQIRNTMMVLVTIHAVLTMEAAARTLLCRAQNHQYYHKQHGGCLDCEPCIPGEEQMDLQKWASSKPSEIFTLYGPTQCPVCVKCRIGFYSDRRAFRCKRCQNCTLHNKHEVKPCTSLSDAECDGVLISKRFNDEQPRYGLSVTHDRTNVHPGSMIAITILGICIVTLGIIFARIKYKQYRKKQRNTVSNAEDGSSVPLMQTNGLSNVRRTRHYSEPSSNSLERRVRHFQRHLSDPGQGYCFEIETDGTEISVSADRKIDKDFIMSLSKLLCEKCSCLPFARKLGLSDASIDTIKHDYDKDGFGEVSYQILAELQKRGKLVYRKEAVDTLRGIGLSHIIEKLR